MYRRMPLYYLPLAVARVMVLQSLGDIIDPQIKGASATVYRIGRGDLMMMNETEV
jgi:hypothetical protein